MPQTVNGANAEILENLRSELRRGSLILAVLVALRTEQYGYTLRKSLEQHGIAMDEGTLYPLLRRLEGQGLLVSEWREQNKRNKRFYRLSKQGQLVLVRLLLEWEDLAGSLKSILQPLPPLRESKMAPADEAVAQE
jgi:PadR family transcriptional regulator PadR